MLCGGIFCVHECVCVCVFKQTPPIARNIGVRAVAWRIWRAFCVGHFNQNLSLRQIAHWSSRFILDCLAPLRGWDFCRWGRKWAPHRQASSVMYPVTAWALWHNIWQQNYLCTTQLWDIIYPVVGTVVTGNRFDGAHVQHSKIAGLAAHEHRSP